MNENDYIEFALEMIKANNLEKYCQIAEGSIRFAFSYSNYERKLYMPYEYDNNKMQNIFLHRYDNKGIPHVLMTKSSKTDKIYNIYGILHELEHAKQQKKIIENYQDFDPIYIKNLISSILNHHFDTSTKIYHDLAFHEYDATLRAIANVIKYGKKNKLENLESFNQLGAFLILSSSYNMDGKYESPLSQNNKLTEQYNSQTIENMNMKYSYSADYSPTTVDITEEFKTAYMDVINKPNKLNNDFKSRLFRGDELTTDELNVLQKVANGELITTDFIENIANLNQTIETKFNNKEVKTYPKEDKLTKIRFRFRFKHKEEKEKRRR